MIIRLSLALTAVTLLAAAPARADANGYLAELDAVHIDHGISEPLMVNLGNAICGDFAEGVAIADIGSVIAQPGSPFTPYEAGEIIYAAFDQICPRYEAEAIQQVTGNARIA